MTIQPDRSANDATLTLVGEVIIAAKSGVESSGGPEQPRLSHPAKPGCIDTCIQRPRVPQGTYKDHSPHPAGKNVNSLLTFGDLKKPVGGYTITTDYYHSDDTPVVKHFLWLWKRVCAERLKAPHPADHPRGCATSRIRRFRYLRVAADLRFRQSAA